MEERSESKAPDAGEEYLTPAEACARLGLTRPQLQKLLRQFRLDYLLHAPKGREVRLRWSDIVTLIEQSAEGSAKTA